MKYKHSMARGTIDRRRRQLLATGAGLVGLAAGAGRWPFAPAHAADRKVVWGTNEAYSRPAMIDPFVDQTGIAVELSLFSDPAEVVTKLKAGGAGVDILLDGSYHSQVSYDAGVLQPIDLSNIPNWEHVVAAFQSADGVFFDGVQYGVPIIWGTDSVVYRGDLVGGEIDNIGALFDAEYSGRIAMPGGLHESLIVGALHLGIDKPFAMDKEQLDAVANLLIEQKPLLRTYWNDIGDLKNLMATGEVVLAWGWAPVLELAGEGIDIRWGFPKQGQLGWYDASYVTTEAEGQTKADAEAFINYLIGDFYGVELGTNAGYRTVSHAAISNMDAALAEKLALDNPMGYLEGAKWWVATSDTQAYEDTWQRVLNA